MSNNPVGWFEIYVQDIGRAKSFYESVFKVQLQDLQMPDMEMHAFPMVDEAMGAPGAIVKIEGIPSGGNSTRVYFSCEDCADEESRVSDSGGSVVNEKFSIGEYGFVSLVTDPDGNMIGLHSLK